MYFAFAVKHESIANMTEKDIRREAGTPVVSESYHITIDVQGPYLVYGNPPVKQAFITNNEEGTAWTYREGSKSYDTGDSPIALCRCGTSKHKPYCDGSHATADWDPALTAPRRPVLEDAEVYEGPALQLTDNESYCAFARFCDAKGRIWNLVEIADSPRSIELAKRITNHCPSGRLKLWDKRSGETYEVHFDPSVMLIEDSPLRLSGPIWVRGGIPISAGDDGYTYEVRNRVTVCRCGMSSNKPFCDGSHASMRFQDGLPDDKSDKEY